MDIYVQHFTDGVVVYALNELLKPSSRYLMHGSHAHNLLHGGLAICEESYGLTSCYTYGVMFFPLVLRYLSKYAWRKACGYPDMNWEVLKECGNAVFFDG